MPVLQGFGYAQVYYKLRDSGQIGKFPAEERFAIVDVRELVQKYEWVVLRIRIFDFRIPLFDRSGQELPPDRHPTALPSSGPSSSRDFILNAERPEPGVLGALRLRLRRARGPDERGTLAYGPGHFDAGFQLFNFRVLDSGEARVKLVFVVNRPERILNLSFNPIAWAFALADLGSFGLTSRLLAPVQSMLSQLPCMGRGPRPGVQCHRPAQPP